MISGGGAGLRYLPKANAEIAAIEIMTMGLTNPCLPNRRAQSSHHDGPAQASAHRRQPLRASRSPHSTQKVGRYIVGDSAQLDCGHTLLARDFTSGRHGPRFQTASATRFRGFKPAKLYSIEDARDRHLTFVEHGVEYPLVRLDSKSQAVHAGLQTQPGR